MIAERRKYNRFMARPDTYAAMGPHFSKVGKVKQISMDGLAFEYIRKTGKPDRIASNVTVFLCQNHFFLPDLPCRLISDLSNCTLERNPIADSIYSTNQCAVQFKTFTEDQKLILEYFIEHHTRGLAPMALEMIPAQSFSNAHSNGEMPAPV